VRRGAGHPSQPGDEGAAPRALHRPRWPALRARWDLSILGPSWAELGRAGPGHGKDETRRMVTRPLAE
jgi:hypothetical protein